MKQRVTAVSVAVFVTLIGSIGHASAQPMSGSGLSIQPRSALTSVQLGDLNKAKNLARQAAEKANGGLNQYRAEPAMHASGLEAPYVDNGDGTLTFTFTGGPPGYTTPTVQSVVMVNTQTWAVRVDSNGPIRSASQ
jgi:hypothetical protein